MEARQQIYWDSAMEILAAIFSTQRMKSKLIYSEGVNPDDRRESYCVINPTKKLISMQRCWKKGDYCGTIRTTKATNFVQ